MGDKIQRLQSISKNKVALVEDEKMRDTLIDLHNYAAMAVMLLDEDKTKENNVISEEEEKESAEEIFNKKKLYSVRGRNWSLLYLNFLKQQKYYSTIMEHDYLFKILILGDHYTGKSTILHRYTDNTRLLNSTSTIGVDFKIGYFKDDLKRDIKLHFWDTGGHPEYQDIISGYYKNTAAAIIVFDVTRYENI